MSRRLRILSALALSLTFVGCASVPRSASVSSMPPSSWAERRAVLQGAAEFDLAGRLAVAIGEEGYSATLRWHQRSASAAVELDGPLGLGGLRLNWDGDRFDLRGSDGRRWSGDLARAEFERRLGAPLPFVSLRYWLLGVPDPSAPAAEQLAADGQRLAGFEQAGWRIQIRQYAPLGASAWELPGRLEIARDEANLRVRLLVDRWREFRP